MPKIELKAEQEKIINFNDGNIIVSASAGSGKTFVMIERAVRLVAEKKAHVNELLVVTFTEAAAKDMKDKLKKVLTDKISKNPNSDLIKELKDLDTADISTIHSFASRLIRNYFFIAGVSPDFSVIDDGGAERIKFESFNKVLRELYGKKEKWFYNLVKIYSDKRSDENLRKVIYSLYEFSQVEAYPDKFLEEILNNYTPSGFDKMLSDYKAQINGELLYLRERAEECLEIFTEQGNESGKEFSENVIEDLDNLINFKSVYDFKGYERFNGQCRMRVLSDDEVTAKETIGGIKSEIKNIVERVAKNLTDYKTDKERLPSLYDQVKGLIDITKLFSEEYEKEKREENVLDFSDLEHYTLKILSDEETLNAIKGKYKYIFADEYQDVNGVQEEILSKISSNNTFMVGDVKQSIYGFRGCRPDFFVKKIEGMKKCGDATEELNYNFRSAKKVIEAVNEIFSFSMQKAMFGVDYKKEAKLLEGGLYEGGKDGRFALHFLEQRRSETNNEKPRIYDLIRETAKKDETENGTSKLIAKIIKEELEKTYYDIKTGEERRVEFKDIAILTRAKDSDFVERIVNGLKSRGIPVTSSVSENVCDFPEVKGLISALKLIDGMNDEIALAVTMLSPIGKFSEQDLVSIVSKNSDDDFISAIKNFRENGEGELKERLNRFYEYYNNLRFYADFNSAREVINKILKDSGYEYYYLARDDGEERVKRIRRFVSSSSDINREYSVKELLSLIECAPTRFKLLKNGEEQAVRVITEHSSKGLEYPVVVMCGLEKPLKPRSESDTLILNRPYMGVAYYDLKEMTESENPYLGYIDEKRRQERINDELRLMYVGVTRAKYSLHVIFAKAKDERKGKFITANNFIDFIPNSIEANVYTAEDLATYEEGEEQGEVLVYRADRKKVEELKQRFSYEYKNIAEITLPLKTSVTGAIKSNADEMKYLFGYGKTDKEKGTALHKLLERCNFNDLENLGIQADKLIEKGEIDKEDLKGVDIERVKSALKRAGLDKIKGETYREKSFIVTVEAEKVLDTKSSEQVLVQGVIDLLSIKDGIGEIYDYKYSVLDSESLKKKYCKQLNLYAYAVENVLKVKVKKKTLINIATGDVVEID